MKNVDTNSGERLSFFKLFSEKKYRVEIPLIQRDYAQGRSSEKEVRATFLDALQQYLKEGEPNRDLDFVYGTLLGEGDKSCFVPLDGQQRLTTLFLLHWYLAHISDQMGVLKKELYKNNKFWVPPIIKDEVASFNRTENPVFEHADARFFLAYKNGKIVGRISAMINWIEVKEQKVKKMRFGWFDFIDDLYPQQ